jgi:predicted enzyme related to lactoylglutathione lyase
MINTQARIGSIVIACKDFPKLSRFWQEALHYVPKYPAENGWVLLKDPEGKGPNIGIDSESESGSGIGRIHLDLYSNDMDGEVSRLKSLGAQMHRPKDSIENFTVMEDPEGNLFCVVDKTKEP